MASAWCRWHRRRARSAAATRVRSWPSCNTAASRRFSSRTRHLPGRAGPAARRHRASRLPGAIRPGSAGGPARWRRRRTRRTNGLPATTPVSSWPRIGSAFYADYAQDVRPTTDDRPFFFHTTKLADQFEVAFGRSMLFGNGLSALMTLMGISGGLVLLFVVAPLMIGGGPGPPAWLADARLLRRARRWIHADRGRGPAAFRAVSRPPRLLAHRDACFRCSWAPGSVPRRAGASVPIAWHGPRRRR